MKHKKFIRAYEKAELGEKLSRREKKALFGKRIGEGKLRKAFKALQITKYPRTLREEYEFTGVNDLFCPNCGCISVRSTGNMTSHPEYWEYYYCLRCGMEVGTIDNSPFVHVLAEMKEKSEGGRCG